MTDGDGLLRAVLLDPGDDAPRLVYADWLDEHGHPDRAAFIRWGCAAGREPGGPEARPPGPAGCAAAAGWLAADGLPVGPDARLLPGLRPGECRVRETLGGPAPAGAGDLEYVLRRGFVAEATLPWPALRAAAPALFRAHPVQWVALAGAVPGAPEDVPDADGPGWVGYRWWAWGEQCRTPSAYAAPAPWMLPAEVWDRLAGGRVAGRMGGLRLYRTPLQAHAALSAACIAFGRGPAGAGP